MSPLMQRVLEEKRARRARLTALPYPEKVRIVEQMQAAARQIKAVGDRSVIMESGTDYFTSPKR